VPNFCFTLEYDGSDFEGWQSQPGEHRTIQDCFESAVQQITGEKVRVDASGRTDAGVHALGQVVSVSLETELGAEVLMRGLNARLPQDIVVLECREVPADFHARRSARAKLYRYSLWNGPLRSPLRRRQSYAYPHALNIDRMRQAAADLVGTHDFASFAASGSSVQTTVRTLHRIEIRGDAGAEIVFEVEGGGFLRHMVRNLVGTLLEIGQDRRPVHGLAKLLEAQDRSLAGPTAPAEGLVLVAVRY